MHGICCAQRPCPERIQEMRQEILHRFSAMYGAALATTLDMRAVFATPLADLPRFVREAVEATHLQHEDPDGTLRAIGAYQDRLRAECLAAGQARLLLAER